MEDQEKENEKIKYYYFTKFNIIPTEKNKIKLNEFSND